MVKLSKPDYIKLCCDLAHAILEQSSVVDYWVEDNLGNQSYTEEAQEEFNQYMDDVQARLKDNKIEVAE